MLQSFEIFENFHLLIHLFYHRQSDKLSRHEGFRMQYLRHYITLNLQQLLEAMLLQQPNSLILYATVSRPSENGGHLFL